MATGGGFSFGSFVDELTGRAGQQRDLAFRTELSERIAAKLREAEARNDAASAETWKNAQLAVMRGMPELEASVNRTRNADAARTIATQRAGVGDIADTLIPAITRSKIETGDRAATNQERMFDRMQLGDLAITDRWIGHLGSTDDKHIALKEKALQMAQPTGIQQVAQGVSAFAPILAAASLLVK